MAVTYVLQISFVLQQWSSLTATLHYHATNAEDPRSALVSHFPGGRPCELHSLLVALHAGIVDYYEGLRRYPIVYYFHGRQTHRSLPHLFHTVGELAAALRWGLPTSHPASREPWLSPLLTSFATITALIEEKFVSPSRRVGPPDPVPFTDFAACARGERAASDPWTARFLDTERWMRDLAGSGGAPPEPEVAYARYSAWLPFAYRANAFVRATAENLGYEVRGTSRGS